MIATNRSALLSPETQFTLLSARPLPPPAAMATTVPFHSNWILLDRFVRRRDDHSFPADSPTAGTITNSRGDLFDVCLDLNAPPRGHQTSS
ncbi:hypothetical protein PR202_ga12282 [Eleusine coracana subsp. coracana]|uniref:Uncharacterized protein n=1 Tax=Eleusine coracana subsp. coracana TaxID=191504 RepID=A0AAV5CBQ5_ELECO|nr:hypothetical protein PR202_ga12282 [Eleusine coracana subsp. coracana]